MKINKLRAAALLLVTTSAFARHGDDPSSVIQTIRSQARALTREAAPEDAYWGDYVKSGKNICIYISDVSTTNPKAVAWFLATGGKYGFVNREATSEEASCIKTAIENVYRAYSSRADKTEGVKEWASIREEIDYTKSYIIQLEQKVDALTLRVDALERDLAKERKDRLAEMTREKEERQAEMTREKEERKNEILALQIRMTREREESEAKLRAEREESEAKLEAKLRAEHIAEMARIEDWGKGMFARLDRNFAKFSKTLAQTNRGLASTRKDQKALLTINAMKTEESRLLEEQTLDQASLIERLKAAENRVQASYGMLLAEATAKQEREIKEKDDQIKALQMRMLEMEQGQGIGRVARSGRSASVPVTRYERKRYKDKVASRPSSISRGTTDGSAGAFVPLREALGSARSSHTSTTVIS